MRRPERSRFQPPQNGVTIEYPAQGVRISKSIYGSILGQNVNIPQIRLVAGRRPRNGVQEYMPEQIRILDYRQNSSELSCSIGSSCDFDISVSLAIKDFDQSEAQSDEERTSQSEESAEDQASDIRQGLTESQIDELPLMKYRQLPKFKSIRQKQLCSICLSDLQPGQFVRILPCVHHFHQQCVDRWLLKVSQCPLCKNRLF